jgi:hypothetical protein
VVLEIKNANTCRGEYMIVRNLLIGLVLSVNINFAAQAASSAGDVAAAGAATVLGVATLAFQPITAIVSCLDHKLQICVPEAAYVLLRCKQIDTSPLYDDSVGEQMIATYLNEERNEQVRTSDIVWEKEKQLRTKNSSDENTNRENIDFNNNLVDQLDKECRTLMKALSKIEISGERLP